MHLPCILLSLVLLQGTSITTTTALITNPSTSLYSPLSNLLPRSPIPQEGDPPPYIPKSTRPSQDTGPKDTGRLDGAGTPEDPQAPEPNAYPTAQAPMAQETGWSASTTTVDEEGYGAAQTTAAASTTFMTTPSPIASAATVEGGGEAQTSSLTTSTAVVAATAPVATGAAADVLRYPWILGIGCGVVGFGVVV